MYKGKVIGLIVRAYNEADFITNTIKGIPYFVDKIFVVDDASKDNTYDIANAYVFLNSLKEKCVLIKHETNKGAGGAIITGFKKAMEINNLDIIAIMDGDNQMDSKHLTSLLDPIIENEIDFTKGNRLKKGYWSGMSKFRLFGNFILSFINKFVTGYWKINDPQNGYIAINTKILKKMEVEKLDSKYTFENDLMVKANIIGAKMQNVLIPAKYGDEVSDIKYRRFIVRTSLYFVKAFFDRIWKKYIKKMRIFNRKQVLGDKREIPCKTQETLQ
ncbi:MAG: glycosyltransferase family 2 protein [Candidatus Heimdallarchaeota archaeon]